MTGTIIGTPEQLLSTILCELRAHTALYCQMVTLLSQIVGPANPVNGWSPIDVSAELDSLRNDTDSKKLI